MMKKILQLIVFIAFYMIISTPLACSKEDDKNSEEPTSESSECSQIELDVQTVFPTEKILINGIHENLKNNLIVEYWYNNTFTEIATYLGANENDEPFIIAPVHPEFPLKGGEIQVIFKNLSGNMVCLPKSLTISALPEAEGYTEQVLSRLQDLLKQRTDFLNIDEATLSGDLANIEPTEAPFAMLYNLLNNEEAEFALIPFLNNEEVLINESLDKASSIDLANRLLKKYGVLEYIDQNIKKFETQNSGKSSTKRDESAGCYNLDAEDLAAQMKSAANTEYSDPNTITGKYFSDLSNAATIVGLIPPAATAATVVGSVVWAIQKTEEAYSKTRLSHFTKFEVSISNTNFLEETACPEPIIMAEVHAASKDWSIDKTIWEFLLQTSSYAPTPKSKNKLEEIGFGAVSTFTSNQLKNLANLGNWKNGILTVPAIECGPIDVLNHKYIKATPLNNIFEADYKTGGSIDFYPIATGKDVLEISLRPEYFSGQTISYSTDLKVIPIELKWINPDTNPYIIEPGDPVNLEVWLDNTLIELKNNLKVSTSIGETGLNLTEEYTIDSTYVKKYTLQTPEDQNKYPITVTAEYTSSKCFRGTGYANPIIAEFIINSAKITVYTNDPFGCFQVGDEKDFNVDIDGEDKQVIWSAQNEEGQNFAISQEGLFTAPNEAGTYIIKAELQSDPEIFDTIEVEVVGSCSCYWNFSGGSIARDFNQAWYTIDGENIQISFYEDFYNVGADLMHINMYTSFLPEEGETKMTTGINDNDISTNLITINGSFTSQQSSVYGPIGNYEVNLKWKNQYLEGSITGISVKSDMDGDTEFPFTLNFGANEGLLNCE